MTKVLKLITMDHTSQFFDEIPLGIDVPEGKIIQINSVSVNMLTKVIGAVAARAVVVAVGIKDSELTQLRGDIVLDNERLGMYGFLDSVGSATGSVGIDPGNNVQLIRRDDDVFALEPTLLVGNFAVSATTPTMEYLFQVDYEFVKLTTDMVLKLALT